MKVTLGLSDGRKVEAELEQVGETHWVARLPEPVTPSDLVSMTVAAQGEETVALEWAGGHVMGGTSQSPNTDERRYYETRPGSDGPST
jgi:hypothetical protein